MPLVVGADEAGYGPNLGPLVVAVSAWRVPDRFLRDDWHELLRAGVSRADDAPERNSAAPRLAIGDSKRLYDSSTGIGALELGVLGARLATGRESSDSPRLPHTWLDCWSQLEADPAGELLHACWRTPEVAPLPVAELAERIKGAGDRFRRALADCGVELVGLRARGVFAAEFNQRLDSGANKAEILTQATLELVAETLRRAPGEGATVWCDRHGGRKQYLPSLQRQFPEPFIEIRGETAELSRYAWTDAGRRVGIEFRVGGEAQLPVALASMTAKYLRELAMRAFNAYWQQAVPGLRPTAGYPVDARRFKQDIAIRQAELGVADDSIWRRK